jgi:diphthamide synthase (EF-2-diphthine--ammonia ligase)
VRKIYLICKFPQSDRGRVSCRRLSLTPLCYLWQREQNELLSEMIEAGMKSILIKVAGIGLTENHLGKNLVNMRPVLLKLVSRHLLEALL